MIVKVRDKDGNIYTNDMSHNADKWILEIHFGTSYTQVIVQDKLQNDEGNEIFPQKNIIIPMGDMYWIDMLAVNENEIGEWVVK